MSSFLERLSELDLPKLKPMILPGTVKLVADRLGLAVRLTCRAAPEQYEVTKEGILSGYIRVRSGRMSVDYPDAADEELYDGSVDGFAAFTDHERESKLLLALGLIAARTMSA